MRTLMVLATLTIMFSAAGGTTAEACGRKCRKQSCPPPACTQPAIQYTSYRVYYNDGFGSVFYGFATDNDVYAVIQRCRANHNNCVASY